MIVKTKRGYQVKSEDGAKSLSGDDLTKAEAEKRLAQVERMKHFREALSEAHRTAPKR